MNKIKGIALWEIMRDGKHGQTFEVTDCVVSEYIGKRIKVKATEDGQGSYKCLVKSSYKSVSGFQGEAELVPLYGCLGTAVYKQVYEYEEISFIDAMERIKNFNKVFMKDDDDNYVEFGRYKRFDSLSIDDVSDIISLDFYKLV